MKFEIEIPSMRMVVISTIFKMEKILFRNFNAAISHDHSDRAFLPNILPFSIKWKVLLDLRPSCIIGTRIDTNMDSSISRI